MSVQGVRAWALCGALAWASAGCGGEAASVGSCTQGGGARCTEYTGTLWTPSNSMSACAATMGTYSAGRCTTAGSLGSCTTGSGNSQSVTVYYSGTTAATAMTACTSLSGTWRNP